MDYLDAPKRLRQNIMILVGYVLIAVAITITALILLYQSFGFGISKSGQVVQDGLVYFSSQPNPASVYINNHLQAHTNTRLALPANVYQVKLTRSGYRDWQRTINLIGGSVEHFDYPLLIPKQLATSKIQAYAEELSLLTESPDHRWLLIGEADNLANFDLYDLKNPAKPSITSLSLPATVLTKAVDPATETLQVVGWADDDQHVLLQHNYDGKTEFILLDRASIDQSQNLNTTLVVTPTDLTLNDLKYDQYYLYDSTTKTLQTVSLKNPVPVTRLTHVLAYKSYSSNTVLYVTDQDAPKGKVLVRLASGSTTTTLRQLPAGDNYLLDLTKYDGTTYMAIGDAAENKVYIYRDPVGQLAAQPDQAIVPSQVLHVPQPNYLSFSANAQFIVAEGGTYFGVYDIQNKLGYNYSLSTPLDAPQTHANWMDGDRLVYVSDGKLVMIDYDDANQQTLINANSAYLPEFSADYKYVYTLGTNPQTGQIDLDQTGLQTPADL